MSMTLRDVQVLRDKLLGEEDWKAAGHAYAKEHDRCYRETHTCDNWFTDVFLDVGFDADTRHYRGQRRRLGFWRVEWIAKDDQVSH